MSSSGTASAADSAARQRRADPRRSSRRRARARARSSGESAQRSSRPSTEMVSASRADQHPAALLGLGRLAQHVRAEPRQHDRQRAAPRCRRRPAAPVDSPCPIGPAAWNQTAIGRRSAPSASTPSAAPSRRCSGVEVTGGGRVAPDRPGQAADRAGQRPPERARAPRPSAANGREQRARGASSRDAAPSTAGSACRLLRPRRLERCARRLPGAATVPNANPALRRACPGPGAGRRSRMLSRSDAGGGQILRAGGSISCSVASTSGSRTGPTSMPAQRAARP